MLGSNKGATPDGKTSTNGQGPYTNNPQVIAQSQQIVVRANNALNAIPSMGSAAQTFYDTFEQAENSTITLVSRSDSTTDAFGNLGQMQYSMNAGTPKAWDIIYRQANNRDSMPFIAADHFMDMIFDGATPGVAAPTHIIYGSMSMSPTQDDRHHGRQDRASDDGGRRSRHDQPALDGFQHCPGIRSASAMGLLRRGRQQQQPGAVPGNEGWTLHAQYLQRAGRSLRRERPRPMAAVAPAFRATGRRITVAKDFTKDGLGLDDRSRYDLFLSQTHVALFINGQLIGQHDIPAGTFPWASQPLRAYYSHYIYHSDIEWSDRAREPLGARSELLLSAELDFHQRSCAMGSRRADRFATRRYRRVSDTVIPMNGTGTTWGSKCCRPVPRQPPISLRSRRSCSRTPKVPPTFSGAPGAPTGLRIVGLLFETFFPKFPLPGIYANSTTDLRR